MHRSEGVMRPGRRGPVLLVVLLLAVTVLALGPGCASPVPEVDLDSPEAERGPAGTVVFDMAHGEVFGADDTSELGQSAAIDAIREAGFAVEITRERLQEGDLEGVSGLILAGPMVAFGDEEVELIEEYVRGGGVVMLTVHVPFAIAELPRRFGVQIPEGVIQSERPASSTDAGIFEATEIADHELTQNVDSLLVLSSWAVQAMSDRSGVIVATGPDTWLSPHAGKATEPLRGSFGVVAISEVGAGTFIAVGDDAVFANAVIDDADNRRFLENVIRLMGRETRPI